MPRLLLPIHRGRGVYLCGACYGRWRVFCEPRPLAALGPPSLDFEAGPGFKTWFAERVTAFLAA